MGTLAISVEQVKRVTRGLWSQRYDFSPDDLNLIDGAFFYECIEDPRPALMEHVRDLQAFDFDQNGVAREPTAFLERMDAFEGFIHSLKGRIPNVDQWIEGSVPVRMRDAVLNLVESGNAWPLFWSQASDLPRSTIWISFGVLDQRWDGCRVERELRERIAAPDRDTAAFLSRSPLSTDTPPGSTIRLPQFRLFLPGEVVPEAIPLKEPVALKTPMISMVLPYPLLAEGIIAASYDAAAGASGWRNRLYGSIANQTPIVAIRTWCLSLLIASNELQNQREAMLAADAIFGDDGPVHVVDGTLRGNRDQLIARVPEAKLLKRDYIRRV